MGLGGLSEMLGMGVVIQLRNMFSIPARAVEESSKSLTHTILGEQRAITNGWRMIGGGASMMLVGSGLLVGFGMLVKHIMHASNELEVLHNQIDILAHDNTLGNTIDKQLRAFTLTTPFTIDKVYDAAKNLMAYGISAKDLMNQLRLTGDWSSMFGIPINDAAAIIGKIKAGAFGYAMRSLERSGIGYKDIRDAGGPISPTSGVTLRGANPDQFLAAVNKVIQKKFGGGMAIYMTTLPGMMSNLKDQFILAAANIGDVFKPALKKAMLAVLSVFKPELIAPFGQALGQGLLTVLNMVKAILLPFAKLIVWVMELSKAHPGFVRLATVMGFIGPILIFLAGAALVAAGAFRILQFVIGAEKMAAAGETLLSMLGPLGWITAAATLFYIAWVNNFSGIRTTLMYFWNSATMVFGGLRMLLSSLTSGVGHMSKSAYDALAKHGLLGITVILFQIFYRVYFFMKGVWEGLMIGVKIIAAVGSALLWLLSPVFAVVYGVYKILEALGFVSDKMSSRTWEIFGGIVGWIAGSFLVARAAMLLWTGAQIAWGVVTAAGIAIMKAYDVMLSAWMVILWVWKSRTIALTAAQWLLNIAMDANPIGIIIGAIALVVTGLIIWIHYNKQITDWFKNLPWWANMLIGALMPFMWLPLEMVAHWDQLTTWFSRFGTWVSTLWDKIIEAIKAKITGLMDWLPQHLPSIAMGFLNPATAGADFSMLTADFLSSQHKTALANAKAQPAPAKKTHDDVHGTGHDHEALAKAMEARPLHVHTTLKMDSKVVAKKVTTIQHGQVVGDNN